MVSIASFKGDWLGFTYDGVHSSTYNIVRQSGSDLFAQELLPAQEDKALNVPGRDGQYFMTARNTSKDIKIRFAFEDLREDGIRAIRKWLGSKAVKELIFDEHPYKKYFAKSDGVVKMNYIAFDSADGTYRVYRGEGEIKFTLYNPYASQVHKELKNYSDEEYPTKIQWEDASGMLLDLSTPKVYDNFVGGECHLYNAGEMDSPFIIPRFMVFDNTGYQSITYELNGTQVGRIVLDLTKLTVGAYYKLDSELRLILGYDMQGETNFILNDKVYNHAIAAGDFFDIKALPVEENQRILMDPPPGPGASGHDIVIYADNGFQVEYDYLYY